MTRRCRCVVTILFAGALLLADDMSYAQDKAGGLDVTGAYKTEWGTIILKQRGKTVTGFYPTHIGTTVRCLSTAVNTDRGKPGEHIHFASFCPCVLVVSQIS